MSHAQIRDLMITTFFSQATQQQYDQNLFNVDEKIQREALKNYYERYDFDNFVRKRVKQGGAELCQAQQSLS